MVIVEPDSFCLLLEVLLLDRFWGQPVWRGSTGVVLQITSPVGTQLHCPCVVDQGMPDTFYFATLGGNTANKLPSLDPYWLERSGE